MVKLCVAGAAGRMGNAVIAEATARGHQIVGAIEAPNNPNIGKTLQELRYHKLRHQNFRLRQINRCFAKRRHLH